MAKKTSIKVRLVPESKPDSSFNYYCYKIPGFGISNSTWPMLGANPKRNSNINSIINWVSLEKNKESNEQYIGIL